MYFFIRNYNVLLSVYKYFLDMLEYKHKQYIIILTLIITLFYILNIICLILITIDVYFIHSKNYLMTIICTIISIFIGLINNMFIKYYNNVLNTNTISKYKNYYYMLLGMNYYTEKSNIYKKYACKYIRRQIEDIVIFLNIETPEMYYNPSNEPIV